MEKVSKSEKSVDKNRALLRPYYGCGFIDASIQLQRHVDGAQTTRRWSLSHAWEKPTAREPSEESFRLREFGGTGEGRQASYCDLFCSTYSDGESPKCVLKATEKWDWSA